MADSVANQSQIVLGTSCIEVTREPIADHSTELIQKIHVVGVYPVAIQNKPSAPDDQAWKYRFDKMVIVNIFLSDGTKFGFDVQEITNQAGWTANLAGQQQCIDDINTWLST